MITASGEPAAAARAGGRRRRLRDQAVRPGRAAGAGGLAGPAQALPRHDRAAGDASWRRGTPSSSGGWPHGVAELERTSRLRHFLSPQLADVVVGDQELLASHRREIVVVFCDFRGFTTFAETSEPEEVMGVLRRLPRRRRPPRARARGDAGAVHRRRDHGVLQRPRALRRRAPTAPSRWRSRSMREVRQLADTWRRARPRPDASASASRRATPPSVGSASRAASTTPPSAASPTSRPGCAPTPADWEVLVTDRVLAGLDGRVESDLIGDIRPKGFSRPVRVHAVRSLDTRQVTQ